MNKLYKNLSLKVKILGNSIILLLFMLCIAGYSIYSMKGIGSELQSIVEKDIPLTESLTSITVHQLEQAIIFERTLRFAGKIFLDENASKHFGDAVNVFHKISNSVDIEIKNAGILTEEILLKSSNENEYKEFEHILKAFKEIEKEHKEYAIFADEIFSLYKKGNTKEIELKIDNIEHFEEKLNHELKALLAEITRFTKAAAVQAESHEHQAIIILGILVLICIVIAIFVSVFTAKYIVSAIKQATIIASGDLTQDITVDSTDEIGQLLDAVNGIKQRLLKMVSQISDTTSQLSSSAEELSTVSSETTNSVQMQKMETEQVATAMNEMTSTIQEVTSRISNTADTAQQANEETKTGQKVVQDTIKQINNLADQIEQAAETINKLEQDSENISAVLVVIKGVAEQTNLLALNAAIEAARAGEQGRGFAVVADEVRTLASRTQKSTEEINQMIEKLQSGSKQAVAVMDNSREQVKAAVEKANSAGASLTTISQAVEQIFDMSTEIASAAEEQSSVSNEVNRNIVRINDMANQTVTATEQISEASHHLTGMAEQLNEIVEQFKV